MKKAILFGLVMLMMISLVYAAEPFVPAQVTSLSSTDESQIITMKSNDRFVVQIEVANSFNIDLKNCAPYIKTDSLTLKKAVLFSPSVFDLPPGTGRVINVKVENLLDGFYEGKLLVKCERYVNDEFVDVGDLINPDTAPEYDFYVSPAGENQNFVFVPGKSYQFLSNPGQLKTARFSIANTGSTPLDVTMFIDPAYTNIISITPMTTTIMAGTTMPFTINVAVPEDFTTLSTNVTVKIGDFTDYFAISGSEQSLGGAAVSQSILGGSISAGNIEIPKWIVIVIALAAGVFLLRGEIFNKKKKGKRK